MGGKAGAQGDELPGLVDELGAGRLQAVGIRTSCCRVLVRFVHQGPEGEADGLEVDRR